MHSLPPLPILILAAVVFLISIRQVRPGSTLAGDLFILGAARNVIVIQNAAERAGETLTFWEFALIGIPLTLLNAAVAWLFL